MPDWSLVFKDWLVFAPLLGPVATVIAAITAALITLTFGCIQARIARSQRDIALDKLKFDLFAKRYEIYATVRTYIEHVVKHQDVEKIDLATLRMLSVKMDE